MRTVTITTTFETDASDDEVATMAGATHVQILEPVNDEGDDAEFVTAKVVTVSAFG